MITLTAENTAKAIERCKKLKPQVKRISDRNYQVSSSRNTNVYHVSFDVKDGERLAKCDCKASEKNLVCYHIIASATANVFHQAQKKGLVAWQ